MKKGKYVSSDTSDARPPHSDANTASHSESENPVIDSPKPKSHAPRTNQDWWPEQVDVSVLHKQPAKGNPLGEDFDYAAEFAKLDVDALLPAVRAAQQLARQRQPRQGAPPAVARQAEVRQQDLLGRPDRVRGQRRARVR
jgi:hypothetical protein